MGASVASCHDSCRYTTALRSRAARRMSCGPHLDPTTGRTLRLALPPVPARGPRGRRQCGTSASRTGTSRARARTLSTRVGPRLVDTLCSSINTPQRGPCKSLKRKPSVAPIGFKSGRTPPNFPRPRQGLGQNMPELDQSWQDIGQNWPEIDRQGPGACRVRLKLPRNRPILARLRRKYRSTLIGFGNCSPGVCQTRPDTGRIRVKVGPNSSKVGLR